MRSLHHLLLGLVLVTASARATEIQIQAEADGGTASLRKAIRNTAPGDTLILGPGTYRGRLEINKPLTLRGQPGAVLQSAEPLKGEWKPAGGDLEKVYTLDVAEQIFGLLDGGRFMAEVSFTRADEAGDWNWRTLLQKGPPVSGFDQIKALWTYHTREKRIYARFEDGKPPEGLELTILRKEGSAIEVVGTQDVILEDLEITQVYGGIALKGSTRCTVRRCKITSFEDNGIRVIEGSSRCLVTECDITRGSLEDWTPHEEIHKANYEIWRIHKDVGNYDRNAINIFSAGAGNKILKNHLHLVFDGISLGDYDVESLDKPLKNPDHGRDTVIAENLIENTRDSGIELGVGCVNVEVHHNILRRTHGGLRFKLPRVGPVFIHHNRLINGSPFNIWFSMDASPAEGYVYHNTIVGGGYEALFLAKQALQRDKATPNWHFVNNLVLDGKGFCDPGKGNGKSLDFSASHNIIMGDKRPWPDDAGRDKGSLYGVQIAHDELGKPKPASSAQDAGLDLSNYRNGQPLPGCEPGCYQGKAPDAGADEMSVP